MKILGEPASLYLAFKIKEIVKNGWMVCRWIAIGLNIIK